jgi:acyl-coenzyme A synthetase/AMP-(fatty) acid ligase
MISRPESIALFFALSCGTSPIIVLGPDPRTWLSAPPVPLGTVLALPPSMKDLATAATQHGFRPYILPASGPTVGAEERDLGFLSCPGIVLFTSGSTGRPKPVYHRTAGMLAEAAAVIDVFGLREGSGVVGSLPLSGAFGFYHTLLVPTVVRGHLELLLQFNHRPVLDAFGSGRHDYWPGTPLMANLLARCPLPGSPPPAPRICQIGTGRLAEPVFRAFRERFGSPPRPSYGSTETGVISTDAGPASEVRWDGVGKPLSGVAIRVGEDPENPYPVGRAGRLWVASPWYMEGYGFPSRLQTVERRGGWVAMADIGVVDEAGRLRLTSRIDDSFKNAAGYLVSPSEIARLLSSAIEGCEVAVVPLVRPIGTVVGILVEATGTQGRNLIPHLVPELLPNWCQPEIVVVTPQLPRLPNGKIDREACVAMLEPPTARRPG